eukprot:5509586-Pyramimonas_sp.AAC.1
MQYVAKASSAMTSRYACKWKFVVGEKGEMERTLRSRLVLRARRSSQRLVASTTACKKQWSIASLDINTAFLKGRTYQELAEATGEKERAVCFTLPPGSATVLRTLPGFERYA